MSISPSLSIDGKELKISVEGRLDFNVHSVFEELMKSRGMRSAVTSST